MTTAPRPLFVPMLTNAAVALLIGVILHAGQRDGDSKRDQRVDSSSQVQARTDDETIEALRRRHLTLPVLGLKRDSLRDTFRDQRGGHRQHEALDIAAVRDTPVLAVEDGTIAKLFLSKPGGITIYQFDPTDTYAYYYAHLSRYADGLQERAPVTRGQIIGYVGTTGNAPPNAPHLHFAIFTLTPEKRWWKGAPIDPYLVFK